MSDILCIDMGNSLVELFNDLDDPRSNVSIDSDSIGPMIEEMIYSISMVTSCTFNPEYAFREAYDSYLSRSLFRANPLNGYDFFCFKKLFDFLVGKITHLGLVGNAFIRNYTLSSISLNYVCLRQL